MNADLHKIRSARLFKSLPERVFSRILTQIKVRGFLNAERVLDLSGAQEFSSYIGYLISGRVLFFGDKDAPLGLAIKDEFFLGRSFSMHDQPVRQLISADDETLVVFIPKEMMNLLATSSQAVAAVIEKTYDSVFERSKLIAGDTSSLKAIAGWRESRDGGKFLSNWITNIEKRRAEIQVRKRGEARDENIMAIAWGFAIVAIAVLLVESFARRGLIPYSFTNWSTRELNLGLGVIGFALLLLTNIHAVIQWGISEKDWRVNHRLSTQVHLWFVIVALAFVTFHSSLQIFGTSLGHFAFYLLVLVVISSLVGQFITQQVPQSIRGEKIKLEALKEEQTSLQEKAELLIDNEGMYKTSLGLISSGVPVSFWGHIFSAPLLWFRGLRVRRALRNLGHSRKSAKAASRLLVREYQLCQKIRLLEISNRFLKQWAKIHRPLEYAVYCVAIAHIVWIKFFV